MYDLLTGKVHVCRDVAIDENSTYDPQDKKAWDLADVPWGKEDDAEFDDPDEDILDSKPPIIETRRLNSSSAVLPDPMGANVPVTNTLDEEDSSDLSDREDVSDASTPVPVRPLAPVDPPVPVEPRRSERLRVSTQKVLESPRPNINIFRSNQVPESHKHMVRVLTTLAKGQDNEGPDEPRTLREAMLSPYWEH